MAGVSLTYLTRLEQGQSQNASNSIIDALARALQLSADERAHLHALARPSATPDTKDSPEEAKPGAEQLLHAMTDVPALLLGRFHDVLAWNQAGHRLMACHLDPAAPRHVPRRPNHLAQLFLDPRTRDLYVDWPKEAALAVSSLRFVAAQFARDRRLAEMVGELSMNSREFAQLWAGHDVRLCTSGTKRLRHPEVGPVQVNYEVLHLPEGNGQRLLTYTAEPGSPSEAALRSLLG